MSRQPPQQTRASGGMTSEAGRRAGVDCGVRKIPSVEKRLRADSFFDGPTREEVWGRILARALRIELGAEVDVTITDNTSTMIAFTRDEESYRIRLHHMFLLADADVTTALGRYFRGQGSSSLIDAFIDRHRHLVRGISGRGLQRPRVQTSGSHYDLSVVFERLNERFFEGRVDAAITWATVPKVRGRRKSIRLGSYSERTGTVRVHPALDHPLVPPYFLEWIVFHELLHVIEGARPRKGRRLVHTSEFKRREEAFPELERARRWERENIDWLLGWQPQ